MKTLFNTNKTNEDKTKLCKVFTYLLAGVLLIAAGLMIYDVIMGNEIQASSITLFSADLCILAANVKRMKDIEQGKEVKCVFQRNKKGE